jgi:basic membrane protein A
MPTKTIALATAATFAATLAFAQTPEPNFREYAVLYNNAKNDGGFNESAVQGIQRLSREHGIQPRENVVRDAADSERALRLFAERGVGNILAIGFINEAPVAKVARDFPKVRFTLIDGMVDLPNVRSTLFREDEAGYLAGLAAGHAAKSGVVGFIGGMPIPPVKRFGCGFVQGVKAVNAGARVLTAYLGDTPTAFRDREGAERVAREMLAKGADVLFPAAGLSGLAVLKVAADAGKFGVGVDVNQNALHPGRVLTSAVKRVDTAAYLSWKAAIEGAWTGGVVRLGIKEDGVGWAKDDHNRASTAGFAAAIESAAAELGAGNRRVAAASDVKECD